MKSQLSANTVLPNFSRAKPISNLPLSALISSQSNHYPRPLTALSGHPLGNSCLILLRLKLA
jgi:hypothetical protein